MVAIPLPPPTNPVHPDIYTLPAGSILFRLYDPSRHGTTALSFRYFGPICRFDHQRTAYPARATDPDRGILYAALTLSGCLVEIFGDTKIVQVDSWEVARITVLRDLSLLDLRGPGAMSAGSVAALCKDSNRQFSQAWSRWFYDNHFLIGAVDGLLWGNAHNDEEAFGFYERCSDALNVGPGDTCPLRDDALRLDVLQIAANTGMFVQPY